MKELVHNREISIRTYDLGENLILVEGKLIDHRYRPRDDEVFEGGKCLHDMIVRLQVRGVDYNANLRMF